MVSRSVLVAAFLILGVHSSLLDDIRARFGKSHSSDNGKYDFYSGFGMPHLHAGKGAIVHSSSAHKGQHHSSGSSSNSHSMTVIGADGKNLTEEASHKAGFDKDSKIDEAQENLMIKSKDGSVVNQGVSHNKSSVDEGDYLMDSSKKQETDKNGHQISINNNKIANHTRSAALDEANQFADLKNADGTYARNNTGHKNTDEHLGKYELENKSASEIGADGSSHKVSSVKGSIGESHAASQNAYSNAESCDAAGNVQTQNYKKKASSAVGRNSDFASNLESIKNADGTSFSNATGNFAKKTYAVADAEESMTKKNVSADGTSSLDASRVASNSSKINASSGQYADTNVVGLHGARSHVVSKKTKDYSLDEANQSAGHVKQHVGKNGVGSISLTNFESGRKDESNKETAVDNTDVVAADGSKSSLHVNAVKGSSLSQRGNNTEHLHASVDAAGNVKSHSIKGGYKNKKTGNFGKYDMTAHQKNADGTMSMATFGNGTKKDTYEAEKTASEDTLEKNADGTFKVQSKGSNSRVNRTSGGDFVHASKYAKGLHGAESKETVSASNAYNTSDAESNQFDHLQQKMANGTELSLDKDSKQAAASANRKSSLDSASYSVDRHGNKKSFVNSQAANSHDAASASSASEKKFLKHADGSVSKSDDSSVQTANEHNDASRNKARVSIHNADGTFVDSSVSSASKNAQKDATDERQSAFVNVDARGNSVRELKKSLVENHKKDHDAWSNAKLHSKSKDGKLVNSEKKSKVSSSALTEAQLASDQKKLVMANGKIAMSDSSSAITHEKNRNDEASSNKLDVKKADGSKIHLDEGSNKHSDLETRGESAHLKRYQRLGNGVESSLDTGYEKAAAKGSDASSSHRNSLVADGKGHFKKVNDKAASHHKIDNKDVRSHSVSITV